METKLRNAAVDDDDKKIKSSRGPKKLSKSLQNRLPNTTLGEGAGAGPARPPAFRAHLDQLEAPRPRCAATVSSTSAERLTQDSRLAAAPGEAAEREKQQPWLPPSGPACHLPLSVARCRSEPRRGAGSGCPEKPALQPVTQRGPGGGTWGGPPEGPATGRKAEF